MKGLKHKLIPNPAWIAPDGECYPCYSNLSHISDCMHIGVHIPSAKYIYEHLYGDVPNHEFAHEVQDMLLAKGFARTDSNVIMVGVKGGSDYTIHQLDTLYKILHLPNTHPSFAKVVQDTIDEALADVGVGVEKFKLEGIYHNV